MRHPIIISHPINELQQAYKYRMLTKVERLRRVHDAYSQGCYDAITDILALTGSIKAKQCCSVSEARAQLDAAYSRVQDGIKRYHAELSKFIKEVDKIEAPNMETRFPTEHSHVGAEVLGLISSHLYLSGLPAPGDAVEAERSKLLERHQEQQHQLQQEERRHNTGDADEEDEEEEEVVQQGRRRRMRIGAPTHTKAERDFAESVSTIVRDLDVGHLDSAEEWIAERLHRLYSARASPSSSSSPVSNGIDINNKQSTTTTTPTALVHEKENEREGLAVVEEGLEGLAFRASRLRYLQLLDNILLLNTAPSPDPTTAQHCGAVSAQAAAILDFGRLCFKPFADKHSKEVTELLWLAVTYGSPNFALPRLQPVADTDEGTYKEEKEEEGDNENAVCYYHPTIRWSSHHRHPASSFSTAKTANTATSSTSTIIADYLFDFKHRFLTIARRLHHRQSTTIHTTTATQQQQSQSLPSVSALKLICTTGMAVAPSLFATMAETKATELLPPPVASPGVVTSGTAAAVAIASTHGQVQPLQQLLLLPDALFELEDRGVQVDFPPNLNLPRFHSVFCCPVSKMIASPGDPPVMLQCGHVFLRACVDSLRTRAASVVACPTCSQTGSKTKAIRLIL